MSITDHFDLRLVMIFMPLSGLMKLYYLLSTALSSDIINKWPGLKVGVHFRGQISKLGMDNGIVKSEKEVKI